MDDNRKFRRVNVPFDVTLVAEGQPEVRGTLRDVAIQGIFVVSECSLAMGAALQFRITLEGGIGDIQIEGKGEVVRVETKGVGLHITAIDLDSVEHLRNIITFNAEDPEEAWEEMQGGHLLRSEEGQAPSA